MAEESLFLTLEERFKIAERAVEGFPIVKQFAVEGEGICGVVEEGRTCRFEIKRSVEEANGSLDDRLFFQKTGRVVMGEGLSVPELSVGPIH